MIHIDKLLEYIQKEAATNKPVKFSEAYDPGDNERWSDTDKIWGLGWQHSIDLPEGIHKLVHRVMGREAVVEKIIRS